MSVLTSSDKLLAFQAIYSHSSPSSGVDWPRVALAVNEYNAELGWDGPRAELVMGAIARAEGIDLMMPEPQLLTAACRRFYSRRLNELVVGLSDLDKNLISLHDQLGQITGGGWDSEILRNLPPDIQFQIQRAEALSGRPPIPLHPEASPPPQAGGSRSAEPEGKDVGKEKKKLTRAQQRALAKEQKAASALAAAAVQERQQQAALAAAAAATTAASGLDAEKSGTAMPTSSGSVVVPDTPQDPPASSTAVPQPTAALEETKVDAKGKGREVEKADRVEGEKEQMELEPQKKKEEQEMMDVDVAPVLMEPEEALAQAAELPKPGEKKEREDGEEAPAEAAATAIKQEVVIEIEDDEGGSDQEHEPEQEEEEEEEVEESRPAANARSSTKRKAASSSRSGGRKKAKSASTSAPNSSSSFANTKPAPPLPSATSTSAATPAPAAVESQAEVERKRRAFLKKIDVIHDQLVGLPSSTIFSRRVTKAEAPNYYNVIYRPIDLSELRKRVMSGQITSALEYRRDVLLLCANAVQFNMSDEDMAAKAAREIWRECERAVNVWISTEAGGDGGEDDEE